MSPRLAIIGTAGRGDDAAKLSRESFLDMISASDRVLAMLPGAKLVSGGAAWADHVAVYHCLHRQTELGLFLPGQAGNLETAKTYHAAFSFKMGMNTWDQVEQCEKSVWCFGERRGSFKDRNATVAHIATHFLAMTFGDGPNVKDGGTAHTVGLMREARKPGWHLDLNTGKIFEIFP